MKAVFLGPNCSGQSTLVNRVLGIAPCPDLAFCEFGTRHVVTFRNKKRTGYRLTMQCAPQELVHEALGTIENARRLYYACTNSDEVMSDGKLESWLAITPRPWLSRYDEVADIVAGLPDLYYKTGEDVYQAMLDLMEDVRVDLFIASTLIEGNFPNLGRGGSLVDLPHYGLSERMNAKIAKELANATHAFYVADYTIRDGMSTQEDWQNAGALLPRGLPLNICFTHARRMFANLPAMLNEEGVGRVCMEVHPADLVGRDRDVAHSDGREVTLRYFESDDSNGTDAFLITELIEFIKAEGNRTLIKV